MFELNRTKKIKARETCSSAQKNIMFLKTHKTGSSTITNILNRFADRHNLTVALPMDGFYHFLWPLPFQTDFVQNRVPRPNILSNHARFDAKSLAELLPDTTKYISILRHPATQFASLFQFMDLGGLLAANGNRKSISLEYFLDNAFEILSSLNRRYPQILIDNPSLQLLRNPQLFDFGFDQSNEAMTREQLEVISRKFNLILIMEHFDESLILLRRKLCWTLDDVVYFKLNQQLGKNEPTSARVRGKILHWIKEDVMLYEYFNASLWDEIKREGESFWNEVAMLRKRNRELSAECLRTGIFIDRPYNSSAAVIYGYSLKPNISTALKLTCERMVRPEIKYLEYFRTISKRL
ncbi:galactose-3-O-sulfotransferase 2-like [Dendronephthya gigantea]|uniref:galactose-3-O-sulfotransferase 2-like n=1 Tax=Dendronephthya gigantea TaxID=151771 RepID=UPI00106D558B|nr:galactose-3-O-sulfotransferase 2-like [Dendronephthya gigantea]